MILPKTFIASLYSYFLNYFVAYVPFYFIRKMFYLLGGMKIGKGTTLNMKQYVLSQQRICIGNNCHFNIGILLDGRGGIKIGNNVSISYDAKIITGTHDVDTDHFDLVYKPIEIEDNVWIGPNVIVLPGIKIGKGAVIGAGAIVTKNVSPCTVNVGIPAKTVRIRKSSLDYRCNWVKPFS